MEFTIKSRKLKQKITFSIPGKSYIYADINGLPGTLGRQICHGGKLTGSTLSYKGSDQNAFEKICRQWFRAYVQNEAVTE